MAVVCGYTPMTVRDTTPEDVPLYDSGEALNGNEYTHNPDNRVLKNNANPESLNELFL